MWETSTDVFYMVSAISVGAIAFVLLFVLFYLVIVLRDISYVSHHLRDTSETINNYVQTPVRVAMDVYRGVKEVMGWFGK